MTLWWQHNPSSLNDLGPSNADLAMRVGHPRITTCSCHCPIVPRPAQLPVPLGKRTASDGRALRILENWASLSMLPQLWLPHTPGRLRLCHLGLGQHAGTNPSTPSAGFDQYEMAPAHNDLGALVDAL